MVPNPAIESLAKELFAVSQAPLSYTRAHIRSLIAEMNGLSQFEKALVLEEIGKLCMQSGMEKINAAFDGHQEKA